MAQPNFVAKILQVHPPIISYDIRKIKSHTGISDADVSGRLIPHLTNMFHTVIYIPEAQEFIIINESPNTVTQTILNHTQNYGLFNASIVRKLWRNYTKNSRTAARRYITDNADERLTSGSGRFKLLLFQETHIPMLFTLTLHSRNRRHWNAAKPSQNRGLF